MCNTIILIILILLFILYLMYNNTIENYPNLVTFGYPSRMFHCDRKDLDYRLKCQPSILKYNYKFKNSTIQPKIQYRCLHI